MYEPDCSRRARGSTPSFSFTRTALRRWSDQNAWVKHATNFPKENAKSGDFRASRSPVRRFGPLGDIRSPTQGLHQLRVFLQTLPLEAPRNREFRLVRAHTRSSRCEIEHVEQSLRGRRDLCIGSARSFKTREQLWRHAMEGDRSYGSPEATGPRWRDRKHDRWNLFDEPMLEQRRLQRDVSLVGCRYHIMDVPNWSPRSNNILRLLSKCAVPIQYRDVDDMKLVVAILLASPRATARRTR